MEHWGDALTQGEIAGRTAVGTEACWDQVPGFWSTIGERTLKYAAWGDGYEQSRFEQRAGGSFVVWYGRGGRIVGVLTHEADDAYERGSELIAEGARGTRSGRRGSRPGRGGQDRGVSARAGRADDRLAPL